MIWISGFVFWIVWMLWMYMFRTEETREWGVPDLICGTIVGCIWFVTIPGLIINHIRKRSIRRHDKRKAEIANVTAADAALKEPE